MDGHKQRLVATLCVGTQAPPLCGAWSLAGQTERSPARHDLRFDGGAPSRLPRSLAAERLNARSHAERGNETESPIPNP